MDSVAIAYWLRPNLGITIDYGHKAAEGEIRAAESVANALGIEHAVIRTDLSMLGSGDLAGTKALPVANVPEWWPYRNQMLVTIAGMKAVSEQMDKLLIGTLRTDGFHVDGRAEFVLALDGLLSMQEGNLRLEAPAISMDGIELIRNSGVPEEILAWAHSCHISPFACGECRGCRKHYETWTAIGKQPY